MNPGKRCSLLSPLLSPLPLSSLRLYYWAVGTYRHRWVPAGGAHLLRANCRHLPPAHTHCHIPHALVLFRRVSTAASSHTPG